MLHSLVQPMSVAQVNEQKVGTTLVTNGFTVYKTDNHFCFLSVNWTTVTGICSLSSLTLLSNNRVAVCGEDTKETKML